MKLQWQVSISQVERVLLRSDFYYHYDHFSLASLPTRRETQMQELDDILMRATQSIGPGYFLLDIASGPAVYRERVYCYELYHQMRLQWPTNCRYVLNGEVDKRSHPIMADKVGEVKPDFLVHRPGDMDGNHAIIEVKPVQVRPRGILKDLETLTNFRLHGGYERAIYLIYGDTEGSDIVAEISAIATTFPELSEIEIWTHTKAGQSAVLARTLRPS